jgi:diguanylate cyclase (GGDEF)-like protein
MTAATSLDEPVRQVLDGSPAALRGRPRSWKPLRRQVDGSASDLMAVPIGGPDRPVGVLQAMHRSGTVRGFDRGDLELCQAIADQLGTALEKGRMVADLQHAATHDTLTDLPNLGQLRLALVEALARRRPMTGDGVLVLAIDVHQLATVNDTVGHEAGDELLVEVGRRLSAAATTGATIGRIGGDKFAFVLPATADGELSRLAALALKSRVEGPVRAGTFAAEIRLAVGVARAPEHGLDATTLLRRAELAMIAAKETATGSAEWEPSLESDGGRRLRMISGLRDTLSQGDIELAYQPKIALGSGRVTGMEALARWTHPELGPISPTDFVPVAEAAGLIAALTGNVLRKALAECKAWHDEGWPVGVAVNLSARSLTDATLVGQIAAMLAANRVAPHWLTLEITESTVVDNTGRALQALRQLRALGVRLAIDDFGTGYSSLTYLKGLPVHEVKIDKAFVDDIVTDRADRAVVGAVVTLAKTLRLTTVAEGVEQPAQAMVLESLGLDEVQGFFYGQPMPPGAAQDWLHARPAR